MAKKSFRSYLQKLPLESNYGPFYNGLCMCDRPIKRTNKTKTPGLRILLLTLGLLAQVCAGRMSGSLKAEVPGDVVDDVSLQKASSFLSSFTPYPVKRHILPVYIDCFDDSSEWNDLYRVTVQDVSEFNGEKVYLCGDRNFSSILITTVPIAGYYNSHYMAKTFPTPKDFSHCHISCRLKLIPGNGPDGIPNIHKVVLRFLDDTDVMIDFNISWGDSYGWRETNVTQADNTDGSPNINWTAIKRIAIVIFSQENCTCHIIMDRLMLFTSECYSCEPKSVVINTFDDVWGDQYDVAAYLSGKGLTGTFYIPADSIGLWNNLTLSQLKDMKFAGHLMANHTWEHPMPFDKLTLQEQIYQITKMQEWMCENGFGDGARILATPGNAWNSQMDRELRPYYTQIRQSLSGGGMHLNPLFDKTHIRVSADTLALAKVNIEEMLRDPNPSVMVYQGHGMLDQMTEFKDYVDFLYNHLQNGDLRACNSAELLGL